ncbi:MAG: hypothetical protein WCD24_04200 [Serratia inhibens]|uniref:hypothetical protein n=1 Tax=Serratia inhibens TaxID=2338073 RepID=UPI003C7B49E8
MAAISYSVFPVISLARPARKVMRTAVLASFGILARNKWSAAFVVTALRVKLFLTMKTFIRTCYALPFLRRR